MLFRSADEVYNKSLSKILDKKRQGEQRNVQDKTEKEGFERQVNRLTYLNLEDSKKNTDCPFDIFASFLVCADKYCL